MSVHILKAENNPHPLLKNIYITDPSHKQQSRGVVLRVIENGDHVIKIS